MRPTEAETLQGIAGSPGISIGRALVIGSARSAIVRRLIDPSEVEAELARYAEAVIATKRGFREMARHLAERRAEASILEAYMLMVDDELLAEGVRELIVDEHRVAEWAVLGAIEQISTRMSALNDPYLRERSHDVEFVGERLLRTLSDAPASGSDAPASGLSFSKSELSKLSGPTIVVAHELSPADTVAMAHGPVIGFVTEVGSRTGHSAIMARALEIPAVVGVGDAVARIVTGDELVVDGVRGVVGVRPTADHLRIARERAARFASFARSLDGSRARAAATRCGEPVRLCANIELPAEAILARDASADGIGLYRTEFLYIDRAELPTEDEQFEVFRSVVETMSPKVVTLRTFDIGGDKFASIFQLPVEINPMLGLRAVRLALKRQDIFLDHLRAMVRATAYGQVRVMIPMVSSMEELRQVRALLNQAIREVKARGQRCVEDIPLGMMIEVPSAAIMAHSFAREAAFLSLGTNDLVQYALAVDRASRSLAYLASPFHPAILHLIANVVRAGEAHGRGVSVCGAMASDALAALLLVGLGVRELSMEAAAIAEVKEAIGRTDLAELRAVAEEALCLDTAEEIEQRVATVFGPRLYDLLGQD